MLNRPISPFQAAAEPEPNGWELDRAPGLRVACLWGLFAAALAVIALRLCHVHSHLGPEYVAEIERTTERSEPIVSRDGRILSADGQVLAEDVEHFGVTVHYRWLEEPADPGWLKQQVNSRLDRAARREPERVAAETEALLARRETLWRELARLSQIEPETLRRKRQAIQRQVEQIRDQVLARREQSRTATEPASSPTELRGGAWLWQTVKAALTSPPQRESEEPLVIREQLDYHTVLAEIPLEAVVEIEAHPERFPGARIERRTRRVYPQGATAAHVVGYRLPLDESDIQARRLKFPQGDPLDYQPGDRQGRTGIERYYERRLRGLRGERNTVFNRRGELVASRVVREPRYGSDLVLSLHLPLQQAAEELLDERLRDEQIDEATGKPLPIPPGGAIVALDVRTGAVLAAASAPRFHLGSLVDHDQGAWEEALGDTRRPLFHRATEMTLPPGSVFKVVSAVAFLESGRLDPERLFACQGYLDHPDRYRCFTFRHFGVGHGEVNLVQALARSCNVYFFSAARRAEPELLIDWGGRFGLGQSTGIDLPGESGGNLPRAAAAPGTSSRGGKSRSSGETLQLAIGQGKLTATPLQIARLMAAVANGGKLVTPRLADSSGPTAASGFSDEEPSPESMEPSAARPIPNLSRRTLEWVCQGLEQVVAHPQGTGYKSVRLQGVAIAGKTGTAESGGGRPDHAWFAGYVPAERPRIAFVVVLEHAGPGGHAAGPVAREFVQALLAFDLLETQHLAPPAAN
ncbi:MAG: peptidoglycan D,D-transpeptidase FtsI family protein [Planctomycetales bacterium]